MLDFFFNKNDFDEKDLNERKNADNRLETELKNVKYAFCFNCLNF